MLAAFRRTIRQLASAPAILTGAKGVDGKGAIASPALNRRGLHRWRVETAARLAERRRKRLARRVPADWVAQFERNGFVIVEDAMPAAEFERAKSKLLARDWPVREMVQGDTITRRAAVGPAMLAAVPELAKFIHSAEIAALVRYVASVDVEPLYYMQTILKRAGKAPPDPQVDLHADTFHSSMKAWLFLDDVDPDEGAFTYVPGSHRADGARLDWEQARVEELLAGGDRLSRRGSLRLTEEGKRAMALAEPKAIGCKANTLVVADTFGFHARGPSGPDFKRLELWAYSRRNPFLPWAKRDLVGSERVARGQMDWLWRARDAFPGLFKQPWKPAGEKRLDADAGPRGS